jgi:hypothetical protein
MKSQTHPFAAETMKSAQPASLGGRSIREEHDDFMETFPDDVPERDIHADIAGATDDDWEAAAPGNGSATHAPGADTSDPAPLRPATVEERVQETAEEAEEAEPVGEPAPQASRTLRPATKSEPQGDTVSPATVERPQSLEETPRVTEMRGGAPHDAPPRLRRRNRPLPRGQRWKERRLPRICWDR